MDGLALLLLLVDALGNKSLVLGTLLLLLLGAVLLDTRNVALALDTLRSNETLDLGGLGVGLSTLLLRLHLTADNKAAHIIILREVEELADVW